MALLSPFRTDTFIAYRDDDLRTSHVSVALWFVDAFTGRKPISDVSVQLRGSAQRAIRNPSGYYCFTDLAPGKYTLDLVFNFVRSDYYLNEKIEVEIPLPNALEPVLESISHQKSPIRFLRIPR